MPIYEYCCQDCGTIFYTNPNNVVGALCIRDNKILMAKRDIDPRKGLWTLPAGFMENAETLQEGAIRETFEETGSKAKIKRAPRKKENIAFKIIYRTFQIIGSVLF